MNQCRIPNQTPPLGYASELVGKSITLHLLTGLYVVYYGQPLSTDSLLSYTGKTSNIIFSVNQSSVRSVPICLMGVEQPMRNQQRGNVSTSAEICRSYSKSLGRSRASPRLQDPVHVSMGEWWVDWLVGWVNGGKWFQIVQIVGKSMIDE